ncbi:MAG: hypothetical protein O6909_12775 [Alphaproteobacteria bacterium]|nr:hypothetical protein [Alphaproteobacteria bacterium]MCZ6587579.1 hypothetical protein [Alphaproteobacteria bacterium]
MHALLFLQQLLFCVKRETHGAIAVEYAFLMVFITIVAAIGMVFIGSGLLEYFSALGGTIANSADQS